MLIVRTTIYAQLLHYRYPHSHGMRCVCLLCCALRSYSPCAAHPSSAHNTYTHIAIAPSPPGEDGKTLSMSMATYDVITRVATEQKIVAAADEALSKLHPEFHAAFHSPVREEEFSSQDAAKYAEYMVDKAVETLRLALQPNTAILPGTAEAERAVVAHVFNSVDSYITSEAVTSGQQSSWADVVRRLYHAHRTAPLRDAAEAVLAQAQRWAERVGEGTCKHACMHWLSRLLSSLVCDPAWVRVRYVWSGPYLQGSAEQPWPLRCRQKQNQKYPKRSRKRVTAIMLWHHFTTVRTTQKRAPHLCLVMV